MADWNILQRQYVYYTVCFQYLYLIHFELMYLCKLVFTPVVCRNRSDEASNGKKQLHDVGYSYTQTFARTLCVYKSGLSVGIL